MKRNSAKHLLFIAVFTILAATTQAQVFVNNDSAFKANTPNTGRLWGYAFGDLYYKAHSDSLNRGGNNQYTGIPQSRNAFQFRRVYIGYDFNFNKKFSSELLLAAEDNFPAYNPPSSNAASGDELLNNKLSFYLKLANIRIKNIWKGTDFIFGQQSTPSFPMLSEKVWNYRSIERTIADIRRTPSYDFGAGLNGFFDPATKNVGFDVLVANGTSAKPASNNFKWWYGDIYAWLFNKKVVVDVYADYQRLNWQPGWHHDRQMVKGYIAYTTQPITIGVEYFVNTIANDTKATKIGGGADTINTAATGLSMYVHGDIVPNKLRFFARVDLYNPNKNVDNGLYSGYAGISSPSGYMSNGYKMTYSPNTGAPASATSTGDPTSKETFITAGLDFMPFPNIHLEPNLWMNTYSSQLASGSQSNNDVVLRLTFFYVFGKKYSNSWTQL